MHLPVLVHAQDRALSVDENFDAGLEPSRAFVCSYPIDGILRASGQRCGHMDGILSDILRALRIKLNCVVRSCAAHNTTRVFIFEQWSIFNPTFAVCDATAHVLTAPLPPLLPTASATPYFQRSSDPSSNFFARPSTRPFSVHVQPSQFLWQITFVGSLQSSPEIVCYGSVLLSVSV